MEVKLNMMHEPRNRSRTWEQRQRLNETQGTPGSQDELTEGTQQEDCVHEQKLWVAKVIELKMILKNNPQKSEKQN